MISSVIPAEAQRRAGTQEFKRGARTTGFRINRRAIFRNDVDVCCDGECAP